MRLLFLTPRFPYPSLKGDQLIVLNRLKELSKSFEIVLLTYYEKDSELVGLSELENYCEEIITVKLTKISSNLNIIRGLFGNNLPLQVNYYQSDKFDRELRRVIRQNQIQIVHAFTLRLAESTKNIKIPVIYELIDSMQLNIENMIREERLFKRWIYKVEQKRIKQYEKQLCRREKYLSVVSKKDKEKIGINHIRVIPNGVDSGAFNRSEEFNKGEIIFSGNMGYLPNIHAVKWFVNQCLPTIKQAKPHVKFKIVGANPNAYIKSLHNGRDIIVTGYVDSIIGHLNKAQIAVAPMRSGSGMQNKIIEAMACGTPVVTTHNGLEGLFAKPDEEILVEDTPNTFSQAVIDLLSNETLYNQLAKNSVRYINEYHSWEHSNQKMADLYLDALSDNIKRKDTVAISR